MSTVSTQTRSKAVKFSIKEFQDLHSQGLFSKEISSKLGLSLRCVHRLHRTLGLRLNRRVFRLLAPDGVVCETENLAAWAKERGLSVASLRQLFNGCAVSHEGWRNADRFIEQDILFGKKRGKFNGRNQETIAKMIAGGCDRIAIADAVGCSTRTVNRYKKMLTQGDQ